GAGRVERLSNPVHEGAIGKGFVVFVADGPVHDAGMVAVAFDGGGPLVLLDLAALLGDLAKPGPGELGADEEAHFVAGLVVFLVDEMGVVAGMIEAKLFGKPEAFE